MNVYVTRQIENADEIGDAQIKSAAIAAMNHQESPKNGELSVVITGDEALQRLNKEFLGIDAPTDVLSFPSDEPDPESGAPYLGDILISLPYAAKQARDSGHSLEAELTLLTVHGVLHLAGHDHAEQEEKKTMWAAQKEIIDSLGIVVKMP